MCASVWAQMTMNLPISRANDGGMSYLAFRATFCAISAMAESDPTKDPEFKRVLGNLLKAPPKPHKEMRLGKRPNRPAKVKKKK